MIHNISSKKKKSTKTNNIAKPQPTTSKKYNLIDCQQLQDPGLIASSVDSVTSDNTKKKTNQSSLNSILTTFLWSIEHNPLNKKEEYIKSFSTKIKKETLNMKIYYPMKSKQAIALDRPWQVDSKLIDQPDMCQEDHNIDKPVKR